MKKVLIIGPRYYNFVDSIESAFRQCGFDTASLAIEDYSFVSKALNKIGGVEIKRRLRNRYLDSNSGLVWDAFLRYGPDFVVILNSNFLSSETIDMMNERSKVIIWLFDNLSKMPDCVGNLRYCDHLYSFDMEDVETLNMLGFKAGFLPQAYDDRIYYPVDSDKDIEILFVGNLFYYPNRQRLLKRVIKEFPGRKILIVGEYKPWFKGLLRCAFRERRDIYLNRNISPEQVNELYNRAKVVLNIHREDQKHGANPRLYEICGSGAYQISDTNPYIDSLFPGEEIGKYRSEDELIGRIRYALDHDMTSESVAAYNTVISGHTFRHRVEEAITSVQS